MSLQKALAIVSEAVEADGRGLYDKAAPLYGRAIAELELALRLETNEDTKRVVSTKIEEYRIRWKQISGQPSESLTTSGGPPALAPVSSSSSAGVASGSGSLRASAFQSAVVMPGTTTEESRTRASLNLRAPATMGGSEAWQTASDLVERGKAEDTARNFARALELYQCSMSYFLRAIHSDDVLTMDMKAKAREQMKLFLTRAEQLKTFIEQQRMAEGDSSASFSAAAAAAAAAAAPAAVGGVAVSPITAEGLCTACGKQMQTSLFALDREWHPQCFIDRVRCAFCNQQFSALDLRFVVGKDNGLPYHVRCHDFTTGLSKSAEKTFIGHSGKMFLKVILQRRLFHIGESIEMEFIFDNETSVKLVNVIISLVAEEGRSSRNASYERIETVTKKLAAKVDTQFGGSLPMAIGRFSQTLSFPLPPDIPTTITNDQAMRREYTLKIKGVCSALWPSIELEFAVTIQD